MGSLGKLIAAALAAVSMALVATSASAAVYLASYSGQVVSSAGSGPNAISTYDTFGFFGLGSNLAGSSFTAQFKYDTSRGVAFTDSNTDSLFGGPQAFCGDCLSPILEASITVNGITDHFNVGGAGYANVTVNPMGWRQTFFALGFLDNVSYHKLQLFVLNAPNPLVLGSEFTGSDVLNLGAPDEVPYAEGRILGSKDYRLALSNRSVTLTAVPEPATWGLMIIGFAGAGAMLRSRRQVLARI